MKAEHEDGLRWEKSSPKQWCELRPGGINFFFLTRRQLIFNENSQTVKQDSARDMRDMGQKSLELGMGIMVIHVQAAERILF